MTARLVPDVHNDGLHAGVEDDLLEEAHAQGPRPNNQIVGGELHCKTDTSFVSKCSIDNFTTEYCWKCTQCLL